MGAKRKDKKGNGNFEIDNHYISQFDWSCCDRNDMSRLCQLNMINLATKNMGQILLFTTVFIYSGVLHADI